MAQFELLVTGRTGGQQAIVYSCIRVTPDPTNRIGALIHEVQGDLVTLPIHSRYAETKPSWLVASPTLLTTEPPAREPIIEPWTKPVQIFVQTNAGAALLNLPVLEGFTEDVIRERNRTAIEALLVFCGSHIDEPIIVEEWSPDWVENAVIRPGELIERPLGDIIDPLQH